MLEAMVKSAALPMVLELMHAAHDAVMQQADEMEQKADGDGFDHALKMSEVNAMRNLAGVVEKLINGLDQSHQQVHGTPAPRPTPKTNFGPHP